MVDNEVYPAAPVALVVAEVRHPPVTPLTEGERLAVKAALRGLTPILRTSQHVEVNGSFGPEPFAPNVQVSQLPRFVNRENTLAITMRNDAVVVETTAYQHWPEFREVISAALDARLALSGIDGLERFGLRYIDEVRVHSDEAIDWSEWINPQLVSPPGFAAHLGLSVDHWESLNLFTVSDRQKILVRYGTQDGSGSGVTGGLRRKVTESGPFFLIDIDSFWEAHGEVPEFITPNILSLGDELHKPVRSVFESMITEKLREEVLRNVD